MKYLGKACVFRVPVFGWALKIAGEVPVERGDRESGARALEDLERWLARGVSVCLFPEGTRSESDSIGPFKKGAFRLAIESGHPIVPVVISGARDLLPKGSFVFRREADVRVQVLDPIDTSALHESDVQALADRVRALMIDALERAEVSHHRGG
jgi:1-acyl-sn-glycerol-3-phosphate acyltransferase